MSKTQTILIIISLLFISNLELHSQVTIGSGVEVGVGSLLDIKEDNASGANSKRGILLPRVNLKNTTTLAPDGGTYTGDDVHAGLMVFNLKNEGVKLCKGVYIWSGNQWIRLGGKCFCEYTIIGKHDGREYHVFCDDFAGIAPEQAKSKCTDKSLVGDRHNYHLMTADEYHQIWSEPVKGTSIYKFAVGDTYMVHKNNNSFATPFEGWITLGYQTTDGGGNKTNEVVGWTRNQGSSTYPTYFPGGPSIGGIIKDTEIVRCIRD